MKLSICCITYNHEKFIAETIEGIIKQQCNFPYELVIGDDCSTDATKKICIEYQRKFPDKIKLLLHSKNLGGEGKKNFLAVFKECKGKYIAICEGDDYWTDSNKLQTQVDFLEANPEYAICFHRVYELTGDKLELETLNTSTEEKTFTIDDLARGNFIHTPSVVFRNGLFKEFPEWFQSSPVGDYVLHMLNARHGLIKYFPEPMAVYRRHNGSIWSKFQRPTIIEKWITVLDYLLKESFDDKVKQRLLVQKRNDVEEYLLYLMQNDNWQKFLDKLSLFSKEDEYISQRWLLKHYPKYIKELNRPVIYRVAKSLQELAKRIKRYS